MSPKLGPTALKAATPAATKPILCGYCKTGHHQHCPRAVANDNARVIGRKVWPCACDSPDCLGGQVLRCLLCKNETPGEVTPALWECIDPEGCEARQRQRLDSNPLVRQLREIIDVPTMKQAAAKKTAKATPTKSAKPRKEPRDCACGCGDQTLGGLFRPGHDARLIKETVALVAESGFTVKAKTQALRDFKATGASDVLVAKYEGAVVNAAAKQAAPKTTVRGNGPAAKAASPKPAAKKAAAKKASPGKAAPVVDEDDSDDFDADDDGF